MWDANPNSTHSGKSPETDCRILARVVVLQDHVCGLCGQCQTFGEFMPDNTGEQRTHHFLVDVAQNHAFSVTNTHQVVDGGSLDILLSSTFGRGLSAFIACVAKPLPEMPGPR